MLMLTLTCETDITILACRIQHGQLQQQPLDIATPAACPRAAQHVHAHTHAQRYSDVAGRDNMQLDKAKTSDHSCLRSVISDCAAHHRVLVK